MLDTLMILSIIAAILLIPAVALLWLDRAFGGPKFVPHLAANVLYLAWAGYELAFTTPYAHGLSSVFLIMASPLTLAVCYLVISSRLTPKPQPAFVTFRRWAGAAYLLAFVAIIASEALHSANRSMASAGMIRHSDFAVTTLLAVAVCRRTDVHPADAVTSKGACG